ncbi:hypothetical protein [Sulfitobacter sp. 1A13679]|uniref:hypothetical protein n=1 Tax=Sulfitobacter sp. 1A13679 TaxID=3368597 RepID=UPI003745181F
MRDEFNTEGQHDLCGKDRSSPKSILTVDAERYQSYLDGVDMTQAQKEEFLQALWSIMFTFVALGFEVHPLQEVCGKTALNGGEGAKKAFGAVSSDDPDKEDNTNKFSP